jgi:hypothetical protein
MSQRRILQRTVGPRFEGHEPARPPRITLFCWHAPEDGVDRPVPPSERMLPGRGRRLDERRGRSADR